MMKRLGVIPAAGKGTRFGELSNRYPKCILPFRNKPILIHNIDWMLQHGCDKVNIVVNYGGDKIKELVDFYEYGSKVEVIFYDADIGPAGSVLCGAINDEAEELLVVLGDMVIAQDLPEEAFAHSFLSYHEVNNTERWCCVSHGGDEFYDKMVDSPSILALTGVYFFKDHGVVDDFADATQHPEFRHGEFQISSILEHYSKTERFKLHFIKILDFGTLPEYMRNRLVPKSRIFNSIEEHGGVVTKSSSDVEKLYKEACWMQNAPKQFQPLIPKLIEMRMGHHRPYYSMSRVDLPTLREIYVYLDNDTKLWENVIADCHKLILNFKDHQTSSSLDSKRFWDSMFKKMVERDTGVYPEYALEWLRHQFDHFQQSPLNFYHGDLCFSNMFYDTNNREFRLIDPRGEYFGSYLYDLAKLNHSFAGFYDIVDSEMYVRKGDHVKLYTTGKGKIAERWLETLRLVCPNEYMGIQLLTAFLFWSMIPLHSHNPTNQTIYKRLGDRFWYYYKTEQMVFPEDLVINVGGSV